ncbi:aminopeptidase [Magnetococcus sp. PR-3]|uniref:aminopeptidase n=1 Tax=Magnetococcus sp. PR-3 TaxID=3120355 RepID=UPI002FCE0732
MRVFIVLSLLVLGGCVSPAYVWQAGQGQLELISKAQSIEGLLAADATDPKLKTRLQHSQDLRHFALKHMSLPSDGSYETYVALDRDYVVWSVTAAPELSLTPKQWCFPVVGCLSYRGYFSRSAAQELAAELRSEGWDVAVSPIPAYSTLGWFADPLLSTTIHWPVSDLAHLIFHELGHQRLYIADDTAFNESYAEAVARLGVKQWLMQDPAAWQAYQQKRKKQALFKQKIAHLRLQLKELYDTQQKQAVKRYGKKQILAQFRHDYATFKTRHGFQYDAWVYQDLNNARLALFSLYHQWVPAFERLFEQVGGDWGRFHQQAIKLGKRPADERVKILKRLSGGV